MKEKDSLKEIIAKKKERILLSQAQLPEEVLKDKINTLSPAQSLIKAINKPHQISLIAEIKKQSPSQGIICENFNPVEIAKEYETAQVEAISLLTEEDFFGGSLAYIKEIKNVVNLPILRKDFIFQRYQVYESRFFGADAILLIADLLAKEKLKELLALANSLGMDCLVEVHNEKDLKKVLSLNAPLIGINNRNLHTLEVDFKITKSLFPLIPKDRVVVVESGIKNYQDILFLKILGVKAVLIGEAILRAEDKIKKIQELMGV